MLMIIWMMLQTTKETEPGEYLQPPKLKVRTQLLATLKAHFTHSSNREKHFQGT